MTDRSLIFESSMPRPPNHRREHSGRNARQASPDPQRPDAALLLHAYSVGAFPMADGWSGRIGWYMRDPRGVLPLDALHIPQSLQRVVRSRRFEIRVDSAIGRVIRACAGDRGEESPGWMSASLLQAYLELADRGHVHSVEAWRDGELVGGLYGARLGAAFFGESMFFDPGRGGRDASKVCLVHLVRLLREGGFKLLDTQMVTDHMRQFGAVEIPHEAYLLQLAEALEREGHWPTPSPRP